MIDSRKTDYSALDHPEICSRIFHPRQEKGLISTKSPYPNHLIPVQEDVRIGLKFHLGSKNGPNILFFHGNGEIAADYDDVGSYYNTKGINFIITDYRGYGRSGGQPTVTYMMSDCHTIFEHVSKWIKEEGYSGPLIIMGRSLGSASALELATAHSSRIDGLIIESGFAFTEPLLQLLGIDTEAIGFREATSFGNLFKTAAYQGPILFIHAECDNLIPYSDGKALYDVSPSKNKRIVSIAGADHNDILVRGWDDYFEAIQHFLAGINETD